MPRASWPSDRVLPRIYRNTTSSMFVCTAREGPRASHMPGKPCATELPRQGADASGTLSKDSTRRNTCTHMPEGWHDVDPPSQGKTPLEKGAWAGEMAQLVKDFAGQAPGPEVNVQNPCKHAGPYRRHMHESQC